LSGKQRKEGFKMSCVHRSDLIYHIIRGFREDDGGKIVSHIAGCSECKANADRMAFVIFEVWAQEIDFRINKKCEFCCSTLDLVEVIFDVVSCERKDYVLAHIKDCEICDYRFKCINEIVCNLRGGLTRGKFSTKTISFLKRLEIMTVFRD
jgi:hypothetical protein